MSYLLTIAINVLTVFGLVIHRQGPTHKKIVGDCLEEIIRQHFHFRYEKSDENHTMLFTVMVTRNTSSPAYEIQENIIKRIHSIAKWFQIEVISSNDRYEFESHAECSTEATEGFEDNAVCQKHLILDFKSNFYVIIVDSENNFDEVIEMLQSSSTFNPKAKYLVYIENEQGRYEEVAESILRKMWKRFIEHSGVLIPKSLKILNFYKLSIDTRGPYPCGTNITLTRVDRCVEGRMINTKKKYYSMKSKSDFENCSIGVISMPYPPFVIDADHGLEIDLIKNLAKVLNFHLNISVNENLTDTWGSKEEDGSWTGNLKLLYEDFYIGIGNIETGMSYATDFSFSRSYYIESLVYVVPIAEFVPRWRVLIKIFDLDMWIVCLGVIVGFAICFYFASKIGDEIKIFKQFSESLFSSYQIIINHPTYKQPVTDLTRVWYLSLAMFSIIFASTYTCSLVYYLTNPIREHQPTRNEEVFDIFENLRYEVGGISRYKTLFNKSEDKRAYKVFKNYHTAVGENDTILYWLNKVAENRNIWTISSRFFANYLIVQNNTLVTFPDGRPRIFVFTQKLMSYPMSMLTRKGHPLLHSINHVISRMLWGGLTAHMKNQYSLAIQKYTARGHHDNTYTPLTVDHLQGAFAMLVLGYILGFVNLVGEWVVEKLGNTKVRKVKQKVKKKKIRKAIA